MARLRSLVVLIAAMIGSAAVPAAEANLVPDACDLGGPSSRDCDGDGIPEECELTDDLETDPGWTVGTAGDTATSGIWERADPIGTPSQPGDDHTPGAGALCFFTDASDDVDGGTTTLVSPTYDLLGDPDAEIAYWRWFSNDVGVNPDEEMFRVDISDDGGGTWTNVETVGPTGPESEGGWYPHRFRVADFVSPTDQVVLRFVAEDAGADSTIEAAIDDLDLDFDCGPCDPPPETSGLTVVSSAGTQVTWAAGGAVAYDVAGGTLLALPGAVSGAACLADDLAPTSWEDPRPDPPPGDGYYYLVRAQTACGGGTYAAATSGAERLPGTSCP